VGIKTLLKRPICLVGLEHFGGKNKKYLHLIPYIVYMQNFVVKNIYIAIFGYNKSLQT